MRVHVLLNSLNIKRDKIPGLLSILSLFHNEYINSIIHEHECLSYDAQLIFLKKREFAIYARCWYVRVYTLLKIFKGTPDNFAYVIMLTPVL